MYKIAFKESAKKDLESVQLIYYQSVVNHIQKLENTPRPSGYKKLKGYKNRYRIRVGIYRIIYTIEDDILVIEVIRIAHRKDAYK